MTALAVQQVVESLRLAGLKLAVTPERALKVTPASSLTAELRDLIRASKDVLIDWLDADAANDPSDWHELAAAYHAHHFNCRFCIAAGRGAQYGLRCGVGAALWRAYSE